MKAILEPILSDHDSDIHLVGTSDLLIDGTVYKIGDGVVWPEVYKITNFAILDIKLDGGEKVVRLTKHYKLVAPEKDKKSITPTVTTKDFLVETIDVSGLPIVVVQGQTQAESDAASTRASLEAEQATLEAECNALDLAAIRPLRAVNAGTATEDDKKYIADNEVAVTTKRARIHEIKTALGKYK